MSRITACYLGHQSPDGDLSLSERQVADAIRPLLSVRCYPNEQEILDRDANIKALRDNQQTATSIFDNKAPEMIWHRFAFMGDENPSILIGHLEHARIIQAQDVRAL